MAKSKVPENLSDVESMNQCGFYYIFDPNAKTIFNLNVYRLSFYVIIVMCQCVILFSIYGLIVEARENLNLIDVVIIIFIYINYYLATWKLLVFFYHTNTVCEVFAVTRLCFMTSARCREHISVLYEKRDKLIKLINFYSVSIVVVVSQWLIFPHMFNMFIMSEDANKRKMNVLNFIFPVSIQTYNQYFIAFNVTEIIISLFIVYISFITDVFLIFISENITAQYEVLSQAFKNIGYEEKPQKGNILYILNYVRQR